MRGQVCTDIGSPIRIPVGPETLGRIINVIGEPIDERGPVNAKRSVLAGIRLLLYLCSITTSRIITRGQSNLTKAPHRGAHSPVSGHPRGSKFMPLNSWGRGSY